MVPGSPASVKALLGVPLGVPGVAAPERPERPERPAGGVCEPWWAEPSGVAADACRAAVRRTVAPR